MTKPKGSKDYAYTTIIISKIASKRLSEARNRWLSSNKTIHPVGIGSFAIFLLDFYEQNKDKVSKLETKIEP